MEAHLVGVGRNLDKFKFIPELDVEKGTKRMRRIGRSERMKTKRLTPAFNLLRRPCHLVRKLTQLIHHGGIDNVLRLYHPSLAPEVRSSQIAHLERYPALDP